MLNLIYDAHYSKNQEIIDISEKIYWISLFFLHFTPKPWEQLQNPGSNSKILGELRNPASNSKILGELQNPGETPKPWEQLQNPESIHSSLTECTYSTCCTGLDHAAFILGCVKKNTFNF